MFLRSAFKITWFVPETYNTIINLSMDLLQCLGAGFIYYASNNIPYPVALHIVKYMLNWKKAGEILGNWMDIGEDIVL